MPSFYGKYKTVHNFYRKCVKKNIFKKIFDLSKEEVFKVYGKSDFAILDTTSSKAPFAKFGGRNPTDRGKNGIKKSLIIDEKKTIISVKVFSANKHDSKLLLPHMKNILNHPFNEKIIYSDSAYDSNKLRNELLKKDFILKAATNARRNKNKKNITYGFQWKIEQIFGILNWNRGIKFCWTKLKSSFLGFLHFICAFHNFKIAIPSISIFS